MLTEALASLRKGEDYNVDVHHYKDDDDNYKAHVDSDDLLRNVQDAKGLKKLCEDMVKILIKLKSPGTKFLYLTK